MAPGARNNLQKVGFAWSRFALKSRLTSKATSSLQSAAPKVGGSLGAPKLASVGLAGGHCHPSVRVGEIMLTDSESIRKFEFQLCPPLFF